MRDPLLGMGAELHGVAKSSRAVRCGKGRLMGQWLFAPTNFQFLVAAAPSPAGNRGKPAKSNEVRPSEKQGSCSPWFLSIFYLHEAIHLATLRSQPLLAQSIMPIPVPWPGNGRLIFSP